MIDFKLPALGADMDEGVLLEWKVKPGDAVKKGQVIAVVDTTKAAIDVECWQEGTVRELVAQPGDKMPVGALMATLLEPGELAPPEAAAKVSRRGTPPETPSAAAPAPSHGATPGAASERRMVSPAARKLAEERGVDLARVVGTGPHGAVTREDVEQAAAQVAGAAPTVPVIDKAAGMRAAIAAAMSRAKREIPHYYVAESIPLGRALEWLREANAARPMAERVLPAALLLKAVATTLKRYPDLNGHWRDGAFAHAERINLGVAISLRKGGLIAPALLDADAKTMPQLMSELTDLVARARAGSLKSSELGEGTITVTNLGDQGSESVFGIIYPPQVALVGFGRIVERPAVVDGHVVPLPMVTASLSADHRVSDGHRGALFLRELADLLQRPEDIES